MPSGDGSSLGRSKPAGASCTEVVVRYPPAPGRQCNCDRYHCSHPSPSVADSPGRAFCCESYVRESGTPPQLFVGRPVSSILEHYFASNGHFEDHLSSAVVRQHPPFQSVKVSRKNNATSYRPNRVLDAGQLCGQYLRFGVWGEITTCIISLPACGLNVTFLGQARLGSTSEPDGAVASVIGNPVFVVHVVRLLA